jgi:peptidoglycan hydrolase-like protein with peptidoglycan-binding domain
MRFSVLIFFGTVLAASVALPQTSASSHKAVSKKTAAKSSTASKKSTTSRKGRTGRAPVVAAYRQMAPTPDRYREIQQVLVDKGYLKSEPSGVWDTQSSEALKQFQTDQKLSPTGKLSSASLIGLGLGPKTAPPPEPQTPPPPAAN